MNQHATISFRAAGGTLVFDNMGVAQRADDFVLRVLGSGRCGTIVRVPYGALEREAAANRRPSIEPRRIAKGDTPVRVPEWTRPAPIL